MVEFSSAVRERIASTAPRGGAVQVPAHYSKLSKSQRVAVREHYIDIQQGLCSHCKGPLAELPPFNITGKQINWARFPGGQAGFLRYPVHLHHDHKTDLTIGAVHSYCNVVLFQYHGE